MMSSCKQVLVLGFFCAVMLGSAGCATQAMKGTPFYTGEWSVRTGNVEDRVALWPLVYYREPALSVLWPIFEKSPDHIAIRPVYAVHGLQGENRVHQLLWPLGRFDFQRHVYRFFPVFWGRDYVVVFPLYWHLDQPFRGKRGHHALFPLWIYSKAPTSGEASRHTLHLAWPFMRFEVGPRVKQARVFPLFSAHKNQKSGARHFVSLPYGYVRTPARGVQQDWVLPLYIRKNSVQESYFYTIPYGRRRKGDMLDRYAMLGIWRHYRDVDSTYQWLFPMYGYSRDRDTEYLVTPLFWRGHEKSKDRHWQALLPLYYRSISPQGSSLYTLLGGGSRQSDGSRRIVTPLYVQSQAAEGRRFDFIPPLLSWRSKYPDHTDWHILGPLSRLSLGAEAGASYLFPILYRNSEKGTFLSPFFQKSGSGESAVRWYAVAPFYARLQGPRSSAWITPLGAVTRDADGGGKTITPLYVDLTDEGQSSFRAIPPLLSWQMRDAAGCDTWLALGLARFGAGAEAHPSHVFPLYYRHPGKNALLTLLWSSWKDRDQRRWQVIPPLFSWRKTEVDGAAGTRALGGLVARDTDAEGKHVRSHVFPFYYANRVRDRLISPVYARWEDADGGRHAVLPPLLSWRSVDAATNRSVHVAAGLYGQTHLGDGTLANSYLFPFYAYRKDRHFLTPLVGRDAPGDGRFRYWLTPLVGTYRNHVSGSWVWPLYRYRRDAETGHHDSRFLLWGYHRTEEQQSRTGFFPLFARRSMERNPLVADTGTPEHYQRDIRENVLSLLLLYRQREVVTQYGPRSGPMIEGQRYRQRQFSSNRLFPLWSFRRETYGAEEGPERTTGSLLWRLYDHQTEQGTEAQPHSYVRRRILWHVWHYERLNGHVSVDSLPFITYDKKPDGFRKFTFLWRGFRYEKHPEQGRKIDFLFIPLWR